MGKKTFHKHGKSGRIQSPKRLPPALEKKIADKVEKWAAPLCAEEGIELVHVDFVHESHQYYLRVYIDTPGGVTMAHCTKISRQLGDLLDVKLELETEYRLEISSPGINRPLFKKEDFNRFKGQRVKIRTLKEVSGKNALIGILGGISDKDCVTLLVDEQTVEIDHSIIKNARLTENNGDDRC